MIYLAYLQGTQGETCPIQAYLAWNLCDMPAGIVPVSKVSEADDRKLDSLPKNDLVNPKFEKTEIKPKCSLFHLPLQVLHSDEAVYQGRHWTSLGRPGRRSPLRRGDRAEGHEGGRGSGKVRAQVICISFALKIY